MDHMHCTVCGASTHTAEFHGPGDATQDPRIDPRLFMSTRSDNALGQGGSSTAQPSAPMAPAFITFSAAPGSSATPVRSTAKRGPRSVPQKMWTAAEVKIARDWYLPKAGKLVWKETASFTEIANILGRTEGSCRSRIGRQMAEERKQAREKAKSKCADCGQPSHTADGEQCSSIMQPPVPVPAAAEAAIVCRNCGQQGHSITNCGADILLDDESIPHESLSDLHPRRASAPAVYGAPEPEDDSYGALLPPCSETSHEEAAREQPEDNPYGAFLPPGSEPIYGGPAPTDRRFSIDVVPSDSSSLGWEYRNPTNVPRPSDVPSGPSTQLPSPFNPQQSQGQPGPAQTPPAASLQPRPPLDDSQMPPWGTGIKKWTPEINEWAIALWDDENGDWRAITRRLGLPWKEHRKVANRVRALRKARGLEWSKKEKHALPSAQASMSSTTRRLPKLLPREVVMVDVSATSGMTPTGYYTPTLPSAQGLMSSVTHRLPKMMPREVVMVDASATSGMTPTGHSTRKRSLAEDGDASGRPLKSSRTQSSTMIHDDQAASQPPPVCIRCGGDHSSSDQCLACCDICGDSAHEALDCPKDSALSSPGTRHNGHILQLRTKTITASGQVTNLCCAHYDCPSILSGPEDLCKHLEQCTHDPLGFYCARHDCNAVFSSYEELRAHNDGPCVATGPRLIACLFLGCPHSSNNVMVARAHGQSCPLKRRGAVSQLEHDRLRLHAMQYPIPVLGGNLECGKIGCDFTHTDISARNNHRNTCTLPTPVKYYADQLPDILYLCGRSGCRSYFRDRSDRTHHWLTCTTPDTRHAHHELTDPYTIRAFLRYSGRVGDRRMMQAYDRRHVSGNTTSGVIEISEDDALAVDQDLYAGTNIGMAVHGDLSALHAAQQQAETLHLSSPQLVIDRVIFDHHLTCNDSDTLFRAFAKAYLGPDIREAGDEDHFVVAKAAAQLIWNEAMNMIAPKMLATHRRALYAQLDENSYFPNAESLPGGLVHNSRLYDQLFQQGRYASNAMLTLLADAFTVEIVVYTAVIQGDGGFKFEPIVRGHTSAPWQIHLVFWPHLNRYTALIPKERGLRSSIMAIEKLDPAAQLVFRSPLPALDFAPMPIPLDSRILIPWHTDPDDLVLDQGVQEWSEDTGPTAATGHGSNRNPRPAYMSKGRLLRDSIQNSGFNVRRSEIKLRKVPRHPETGENNKGNDLESLSMQRYRYLQCGALRIIDLECVPRGTPDIKKDQLLVAQRERRRMVVIAEEVSSQPPVVTTPAADDVGAVMPQPSPADSRFSTFDVPGGTRSFAMNVASHAGELLTHRNPTAIHATASDRPPVQAIYNLQRFRLVGQDESDHQVEDRLMYQQSDANQPAIALDRGFITIAIGRFSDSVPADELEHYLDSHDDVHTDFTNFYAQEQAHDAAMPDLEYQDFLHRIWINGETATDFPHMYQLESTTAENIQLLNILDDAQHEHPKPQITFLIRSIVGWSVARFWRRLYNKYGDLDIRFVFALRAEMVQEINARPPPDIAINLIGPSPLGMYYTKDQILLRDLAATDSQDASPPPCDPAAPWGNINSIPCRSLLKLMEEQHEARSGGVGDAESWRRLVTLGHGRNRFWP